MSSEDYSALGLKVGLEIHQQLSTGKLFCSCPCKLSETVAKRFNRTLHASRSEMGELDRAALEEAQKQLKFIYESTEFDCLVEADEEPPHAASSQAVRTTLLLSKMVGAAPVDEIEFMRKIVIDGSNTSGFQRTALIAMGGALEVSGKKIGVDTICLEEDAARRIAEEDHSVIFRIDRLGIPLIEIATSPDIRTPEEARDVAERIGTLLRATRRVRRGIGSIREDLNISISGGARVEVKGVQELGLLPLYVQNEIARQKALIAVKEELAKRGVMDIPGEPVNITKHFQKTKSKVILKGISGRGVVLAVRLPGFAGLMRPDERGVKRLGREMALHARVAGVGGIFHSDELPDYGIIAEEVALIRKLIEAKDQDGFVLVSDSREKASSAIDRVVKRARQALAGVPEETRDPLPDGTTAYSRPLPGRARMYPETDVPPITVTKELIGEVGTMLPELPEQIANRLQTSHSLSREQADALVKNGFDLVFDEIVSAGISSKLAARALVNSLPELEGEGLDISALTAPVIIDVLKGVESRSYSKEAIPEILRRMMLHHECVDEAAKALKLCGASEPDVEAVIDRILAEKRDFVLDKKDRAIAPLMGLVMKELRGKTDGKILSDMLSEKIKRMLGEK
jgi:glutamyl-tRNA(Gln) amidotransferase subunit E